MSPLSPLVVVPAFNAGKSIGRLIPRIAKCVPRESILVIDDGSSDDSGEVARKSAAAVVTHKVNKGKGAALKTGFARAITEGFDSVITMDADLQHDPGCIPGFISLGRSGRYDMIVGTRKRTDDMPRARNFANATSSAIVSFFANALIRDSQSGYRWISTRLLRRIELSGDRYDLESEILIKAGRAGMRIGELEVPTIYDGSESFINPLVDGFRFVKLLQKSLLW